MEEARMRPTVPTAADPRVVDAHQHFWPAGLRKGAPGTEALDRGFFPADLESELAGGPVGRTVLVQCAEGPEENDRMAAYAAAWPRVAGVVAWLPPDDAGAAARELDRVRAVGLPAVGARSAVGADLARSLADGGRFPALAVAADAGLAWDVVVKGGAHVDLVEAAAAALPRLRIVVDHLATPPAADGGWEPWAGWVRRLAAHPNVAVKVSVGVDVLTRWTWRAADLAPYVARVLDAFGPDRAMLAGNWPVVRLARAHGPAWADLDRLVVDAGVGADGLRRVRGGTADAWYRLPGAPPEGPDGPRSAHRGR
jgi:L-fuconolactonase